jgi:hypothetical protein
MPPLFLPHLFQVLSVAAIIFGITAAKALASERIVLDPNNWVEQAGSWTFNGARYVGRPARDPEAITLYNAVSGPLSTFFGSVTVSSPSNTTGLGEGLVLLRGQRRDLGGGKFGVSGYLAGFARTPERTFLEIFKRDLKGHDKPLCNKEIRPKRPTGPLKLEITVSGKSILIGNSGEKCRAADRTFEDGFFGFVTSGGGGGNVFKVHEIDLVAK